MFNVGLGIKSLVDNIKLGNVGGAVVDVLGIAGDMFMTAVPVLPGGTSSFIKTARAADDIVDGLKTTDVVSDIMINKTFDI